MLALIAVGAIVLLVVGWPVFCVVGCCKDKCCLDCEGRGMGDNVVAICITSTGGQR